jgi:hypothetical protein
VSPRYRTRTGVVIDTTPEAAQFLGAEEIGGGDAPQAEPTAVTQADRIAPAVPEGGPTPPVQEPAEGTDAAEPVQEPPAPAEDAQQPMTATGDNPETVEMPAAAPAPAPEPTDPQPQPLSGDDYEQWTTVELRAEMRKRNENRAEGDRLRTSQDKPELIADLRADDETQQQQ